MFKKLKDKKGFTLVELIVVLVILAILAALLIPTLTGYIDKANQRKGGIAECSSWLLWRPRRRLSESYGKAGAGNSLIGNACCNCKCYLAGSRRPTGQKPAYADEHIAEIKKLSEVGSDNNDSEHHWYEWHYLCFCYNGCC